MARKTKTRERLITTAADLFLRKGYAQTGVNEIMQQAHATSGSFYHFFPTKDDLLLAVVDHVGEILETEVFGPAEDLTTDPIERVVTVIGASRTHLIEHDFTLGSPLGSLAAEISESHPAVRQRIAELFEEWVGRVRGYLVGAGERFPPGVNHDALARFALSTLEGAILQARVERNLAAFDASVAELRRHLQFLERASEPAPRAHKPGTHTRTNTEGPAADWRAW